MGSPHMRSHTSVSLCYLVVRLIQFDTVSAALKECWNCSKLKYTQPMLFKSKWKAKRNINRMVKTSLFIFSASALSRISYTTESNLPFTTRLNKPSMFQSYIVVSTWLCCLDFAFPFCPRTEWPISWNPWWRSALETKISHSWLSWILFTIIKLHY